MTTAGHTIARSSRRARWTLVTAGLGLSLIAIPAPARASDPVTEWSAVAQGLIVVPALAPVAQTRAMAIVHVAMHDAVNGITGRYAQYGSKGSAPAGGSPEAAAISAAYTALLGLVGSSDTLVSAYALSLQTHAIMPSDPGLAFGQITAEGILALRQQDGAALASFPYLPPDAGMLGVWGPISSAAAAQALLPGWGSVTPWVLRSGSQFRPDPPPALDSERYAKDYNEVLQLGAAVNSTRTNEQTQIAAFWRASPTAIWNPILTQAIDSRNLSISEAARIAALFYLAAADASVACWEGKYFYDFWRPQPAIANGDLDGNSATTGDPAWRPHVGTPPHPEYPSGHTANSGAMAFVLSRIFGDTPGFVIEATSPQTPGFVRHWQTFSEGVEEVIDARVYSGIHFRAADDTGARMGRQVAQFVLTHALRPVK